LRDLLAAASATVQPFPRTRPFGGGDPQKTFFAWEAFNRAVRQLDEENAKATEQFHPVPSPDLRTWRGVQARDEQLFRVCLVFGLAGSRFTARLREIDLGGVDARLALFVFDRAKEFDRPADGFMKFGLSIATYDPVASATVAKKVWQQDALLKKLEAGSAAVRAGLERAYQRKFPAAERPPIVAASPPPAPPIIIKPKGEAGYRVWTSADGKFQVEAIYLGLDPFGGVTLRKHNGKTIVVPIDSFSRADCEYINGVK
jgi:hypothetical protein